MPAGHLQLAALVLDLTEQPGVEDAPAPTGRRTSAAARGSPRRSLRAPAPDDERTDDPVLAQHRNGDDRPPAALVEHPQVRIEHRPRRDPSTTSGRPSFAARPTRVSSSRMRSAWSLSITARLGPVGARGRGSSRSALRVLHHRAAVGVGELHGVLDDRLQHLVEVEAGADRLADLAQRLELVHLAGQLLRPVLAEPARGRRCGARSRPGRRMCRGSPWLGRRTGPPRCATATSLRPPGHRGSSGRTSWCGSPRVSAMSRRP